MESNNWIKFDGKKYHLGNGETALDAMLRGGANLSFSCRKGSCHSCLLEAVSGELGEESQARLSKEMREKNLFLPCVTSHATEVEARKPDLSQWFSEAVVIGKTQLSKDIWKLSLEPLSPMDWRAGQFINLQNENGDTRSYSIASIQDEDYFVELHIRHYPGGKVSDWVVSTLQVNDTVKIQGPTGTCYYDTEMAGRPLLLIAVGTGSAPLIGVARDALRRGHSAPISFYHGAAIEENLYLKDQLSALEESHPNFKATCASLEVNGERGITDIALSDHPNLVKQVVFLAGAPDVIEDARIKSVAACAQLSSIYSDPFETSEPYMPKDLQKMSDIKPDPELWAALGEGEILRNVLTDFYELVFEDPRLAPFFHKVTKDRVAGKQYEFIANLLRGTRGSFVEPPFNAHHWMVISDELFDYRENLFFSVVKKYNVPEHLSARLASIHETFRREIVKSAERGIIHDGVEVNRSGYSNEVMDVASVCDGCYDEINAGSIVRMHQRTGEVFCSGCEATAA